MINIPMQTKAPLDQGSLTTINIPSAAGTLTAQNILTLNKQSTQKNTVTQTIPAYRSSRPSDADLQQTYRTRQTQAPTHSSSAAGSHQTQRTGQAPARPSSAAGLHQTQSTGQTPARPSSAAGLHQTQSTGQTPARANSAAGTPDRKTGRATSRPNSGLPAPDTARLISAPVQRQLPVLRKPVQKGQKTALAAGRNTPAIRACFGWNTTNPQCDVDVSAFLLGSNGKVPGDSWFVFYGQTISPDKSVRFHNTDATDRETITIDFTKLNANVKKIVFVLTINDAFEKKLHFGMLKDAYIRILDSENTELVSFKMTDYYSNVISMMIGEVYEYNGTWKFNAIGNGVARDLAGLCTLYGVQVSN